MVGSVSPTMRPSALRGFALGRKSWLFHRLRARRRPRRHHGDADPDAKLNDVDPQAWLANVSPASPPIRLIDWPSSCPGIGRLRYQALGPSYVTMHVNKVNRVTTITRLVEDLGEDEDGLRDVANEMDAEDGLIWVYGAGQDDAMAFTDFGIETADRAH
jgi:hypothetical protein